KKRVRELHGRTWKTSSAIFSSFWSTWPGSSKWIPNRRCERPTPNSGGGLVMSSGSSPNAVNQPAKVPLKRWNRCGRKRRSERPRGAAAHRDGQRGHDSSTHHADGISGRRRSSKTDLGL